MCNVYAMYSFEPFDSNHHAVDDPFAMCWDNQLGQVTKYDEKVGDSISFGVVQFDSSGQ